MTSQLHKKDGAHFAAWSTGTADFLADYEYGGPSPLIIGVYCRFGNLDESVDIALFDTGSRYSVISADTAETISEQLGAELEEVSLHTRHGIIKGNLRRLKISLLAKDGTDLEVDGTVFVSKDWPGPNVLGFTGFMERMRIALDPGNTQGQQVIYFGPVD